MRQNRGPIERLNGEDGLGAIYPAMANSVMMFDVLGCSARLTPNRAIARKSVENLLVIKDGRGGLLPALCFASVGHRDLSAHALLETGDEARRSRRRPCAVWNG